MKLLRVAVVVSQQFHSLVAHKNTIQMIDRGGASLCGLRVSASRASTVAAVGIDESGKKVMEPQAFAQIGTLTLAIRKAQDSHNILRGRLPASVQKVEK